MYASIWMIKQTSALQLFAEAAGFAAGAGITSIYPSIYLYVDICIYVHI